MMEDAAVMATALGRREFHLVGHDWGGAVAWVVATRYPDRVKTLTVLFHGTFIRPPIWRNVVDDWVTRAK